MNRVTEHIKKINHFASLLYQFIVTQRDANKKRETEVHDKLCEARKLVREARKLRTCTKSTKESIEECKRLLKVHYSLDIDALETAEEL